MMPLFNFFKNKQRHQKLVDESYNPTISCTRTSSEDPPPYTRSSATSSISDKDTISLRESEKTPQNMLLIPPGQDSCSQHYDLQKSFSSPSTAREQHDVTNRFKGHDEFDAMLQQETQAISDQVAKRQQQQQQQQQVKPKSTRLTFELPERPPRPSSRTSSHHAYPYAYKRYSLPDEIILSSIRKIPRRPSTSLFRFFGGGTSSHQRPIVMEPTYGDHVNILHRPSVLTGRVRYIGPVEDAPGNDWFGIELDVPGNRVTLVMCFKGMYSSWDMV